MTLPLLSAWCWTGCLGLHLSATRWLGSCGALLAFMLCPLIGADIFSRNILGTPVKGIPEIVSFTVVIIVSLQVPHIVVTGSMLRMSQLLKRLPKRQQQLVNTCGYLLGMLFFVCIAIGTFDFAVEAFTTGEYEGEGSLHVPAWPARLAVLLSAIITALSYLVLILAEWFTPAAKHCGNVMDGGRHV